jgi:hypothetical protein
MNVFDFEKQVRGNVKFDETQYSSIMYMVKN